VDKTEKKNSSDCAKISIVIHETPVFGGANIKRYFIDRNGSKKEMARCFDCPLHFVTKDGEDNYCDLPVGSFKIEEEFLLPYDGMKICTHVCLFKKAQYGKTLQAFRKFLKEETKQRMQDYLGKPYTKHGDDFVLPSEKELGLCE
jgi:hypothetical protein